MANIKHFEATVQLDSGLIIPVSAAAGATLQSDASGVASWQVSGAARQNLRVPAYTPVWACSTSNIASLEGTLTIDGYVTEVGNLVLLAGQTEKQNNGLWTVAAGAWARPAEAFTGFELKASRFCVVLKGTSNKRKLFMLDFTEPVTIGTTAQTWVQMPQFKLGAPEGPNTARKQGIAIEPNATKDMCVYINVQGNAEAWAFTIEVLVDATTVAKEGAKGPGTSQYAFALPVLVKAGGTYQVNITETTGKVTPVGEFRTTYQPMMTP